MVEVSYADFAQLDIRIGQVTQAEPYPEARVPAIKLWVDFGGDLVPDEAGKVVLMRPDQNVPIGGRLF